MAVLVETDNGFLVDNEVLLNGQYRCVNLVAIDGQTPSKATIWKRSLLSRPQNPYFTISSNPKTQRKKQYKKHGDKSPKSSSAEVCQDGSADSQIVCTQGSVEYFKEVDESQTRTAAHTAGDVMPPDGLSQLCHLAKLAVAPSESTHVADLMSVRSQKELEDLEVFNCMIGNPADQPLLLTVLGGSYLIPADSQFLMSDISFLQPLIDTKPPSGYNLIVIDPPWGNGSVRRSKRYSSLQHSDLLTLPIDRLAASHAIVIVWTTNHPKHIEFVKDTLFPHWSVSCLAEWDWMKVTTRGEPVIPIDSVHRKPFEPIIIGCFDSTIEDTSPHPKKVRLEEPAATESVHRANLPQHKVICSIPSPLHSQKPILSDVFIQYLPKAPKCLELFARNLLPGWTSWGNEVLKFQNTDLYWKQTDTGTDTES